MHRHPSVTRCLDSVDAPVTLRIEMLGVLLTLGMIGEPCYGLEGQAQAEGRHLWVEYDDDLSPGRAEGVLEAADDAWEYYVDVFGWPAPPEPMAMRADLTSDMAFGQCISLECDGVHVPRCHVFGPSFAAGRQDNTAAHEIGHAFQYGLMGNYIDSLASWAWWMEGTAEYMSYTIEEDPGTWSAISVYLGNPQWMLHNEFAEFVSGNRTGHMYGTAILGFFIDEYYGGPHTVRQTWEWGAARSGERIFFPDAIEGVGIDFDEFWDHYLARLTVLDLEVGPNLQQIPAHTVMSALPGSGAPPPATRPEGLGIGIIRVPADLGSAGMDLRITLDVDPSVEWHAVLVRADGTAPGSAVIEYVRAEFSDDGSAIVELANFDGAHEAFLAVSPESIERIPFDYEVQAELVPGQGSEDPTDTEGSGSGTTSPADDSGSGSDTDAAASAPDGASGCGCTSSPQPGPVTLLWPLLLGAIRRRR